MPRSADALIKPELLVWARKSAGMGVEEAAVRLKLAPEKVNAWESGDSCPTVKQLRKAASLYRQSFAAFYLPEPPPVFRPPMKDYRRFPGKELPPISSQVVLDSRLALNRRQILLELYGDRGEEPLRFTAHATLRKDPETLGGELRELLDVTSAKQRSWRDSRVAFNEWRALLETQGVLVFQSSRIDVTEMRGYSIWADPLPLIVVNRKDAYAGRSFTLLHELAHLVLRSAGICDLDARADRPPEEQSVEVFCNQVSAAALVPRAELLSEREVETNRSTTWADEDLYSLSRRFGVSREVIIRRLLTLGRTTELFYQQKRRQYAEEAELAPKPKGFVHPATDAISLAGKPFVRLVLGALYSDRITASDASDYLGLKLRHLDRVEQSLKSV